VVLTCGQRSVDIAGIVDSGADGTLLPLAVAPYLGLDPAADLRPQPGGSGGAGGTHFPTWATTKTIRGQIFAVPEPGEPAEMFGQPFDLAPAFAQGDTVLWGRRDFFSYFKITFENHARFGPIFHLEC
jgi:hypothetical protein